MNQFLSIKYDLEERTAIFSERLIELCKKLPKSLISIPLINQLVRSGTSIGANYREANGASSRKDFGNKIYICKKEAKETYYWLRLLLKSCDNNVILTQCQRLLKETHELSLIFSKIASNTFKNSKIK